GWGGGRGRGGSPEPPVRLFESSCLSIQAIEVNRPYLLARALHDRTTTARARASRATETVIAGHDHAIFERIGIDVPQKNRFSIVPLHSELLIEIAVVNFTSPADADRVAAHETVHSRWIECLNQKLHVIIEAIAATQISGKPADREIRERVKSVKHNSEML